MCPGSTLSLSPVRLRLGIDRRWHKGGEVGRKGTQGLFSSVVSATSVSKVLWVRDDPRKPVHGTTETRRGPSGHFASLYYYGTSNQHSQSGRSIVRFVPVRVEYGPLLIRKEGRGVETDVRVEVGGWWGTR